MSQIHTLSVLCEDVDGIASRITGMFTRRAFSIISIASGRTEVDGVNRFTIQVEGEDHVIEQITKQLNKLIPVIKVSRHDPESIVCRSLMLVKVSADNSNRTQVVEAAKLFRRGRRTGVPGHRGHRYPDQAAGDAGGPRTLRYP